MKKAVVLLLCWMVAAPMAQAVDFKWMNRQGELHDLSQDYHGKPVLIHIWASWCGPCRAELPEMAAWLRRHPKVNVLPISVDHDMDAAAMFLHTQGIDWPVLLTNQQQAVYLGIRGLPTTILVNAEGQILDRRMGMQDWQNRAWTDEVEGLFTVSH